MSLAAAVMSISYSTIAIGASIAAGRQPDAYYNMDELPVITQVFGAATSPFWQLTVLKSSLPARKRACMLR